MTGHHVGHYSALGQVVGDIRKKQKYRVVGIADVFCETVSLRTSCERVHTNPTVLDAAKKIPHRDAMRQPKPSGFCRAGSQGSACNPTAQALCVAREQQSMTNDYQAVVGSDPVWGKDDRAPPALGSCGRHQLRRTSGNYTECSASAALAEPKLGVGDLACIGTRERPSYKQ